jgi:hypothetical protein
MVVRQCRSGACISTRTHSFVTGLGAASSISVNTRSEPRSLRPRGGVLPCWSSGMAEPAVCDATEHWKGSSSLPLRAAGFVATKNDP